MERKNNIMRVNVGLKFKFTAFGFVSFIDVFKEIYGSLYFNTFTWVK